MSSESFRRSIQPFLWGFFVVCVAVIFLPVVFSSKPVSRHWTCLWSVRETTLGCVMYAEDHDERFPKAGGWMDLTFPYIKSEMVFHDVSGVKPGDYGYAFRTKASNLNQSTVKDASQFELLFDSTLLYRNASSELESLPRPGRHFGFDTIGLLDGHAMRRSVQ